MRDSTSTLVNFILRRNRDGAQDREDGSEEASKESS
jgi:hypothetical protein